MILILTAGFGDGHNTAARNLASAWKVVSPEETVQIVDLFDKAHPFLSPLMKKGYQGVITLMPKVWSVIYKRSAALDWEQNRQYFIPLQEALLQLLERDKPKLILSTYPLYSKLLEQVASKLPDSPPIYTVITDSTTIHPTWFLAPSQRCFVADQTSKESAMALGVPAEKLEVTGFPVHLDFMEVRESWGEDAACQKVLYLPSTDTRHVKATLDALRPSLLKGVKLTLPLGKHQSRLYHVVRRFLDQNPTAQIEVSGWTNQIPKLLQTHDVVVCKAGGAILHEALAACCPAVIDFIVPGQEEGNAECLVNLGGGIVSESPEETGRLVEELLANHKQKAKAMKKAMKKHSEPDAAVKIVKSILGLGK